MYRLLGRFALFFLFFTLETGISKAEEIKGWVKGKGYGWIWGSQDEIGSLNALTSKTILNALTIPKTGKVYDLGISFDRSSYQWPQNSSPEIISFRTPEGLKRSGDLEALSHQNQVAWHTSAVFLNDNVGTQIDSLCHITVGDDNHWYNNYREAEYGGNFGPNKACADKIPPIITRGVLIDVARAHGVGVLPAFYEIGPDELKSILEKQGVDVRPGDAVFIRTGLMSLWSDGGHDKQKLAALDNSGINLAAARWLVEEKGAVLIGSDNAGLECVKQCWPSNKFYPVHSYLLVEQGVYIGEFHYLEDLAKDQVYEFLYLAATPKIRGTTAGLVMRPAAIR
jgi:kynurenine formamidase